MCVMGFANKHRKEGQRQTGVLDGSRILATPLLQRPISTDVGQSLQSDTSYDVLGS